MRSLTAYSLFELLFALAIVSILVGIAAPDFQGLVERTRSDRTIKLLERAIEMARIAAISSQQIVTLCRSRDGGECGGQWQDGVLIFRDGDGDREIDDDEILIRWVTFPGYEGQLRWRAFQNRQYLQFTPQGFTRYQNGNFTYCPADGDERHARQLIINRLARVRHAQDSDGDGIQEDSRGRPLRC